MQTLRQRRQMTGDCIHCGAGLGELHDVTCVAARINKLAELPDLGPKAAAFSEGSESRPQPSSPSISFDWRHEALARQLCVVAGYDPDLKVVDVKQAKVGPFGSVAAGAVQPAWHCYLQMSVGIVDALAPAS